MEFWNDGSIWPNLELLGNHRSPEPSETPCLRVMGEVGKLSGFNPSKLVVNVLSYMRCSCDWSSLCTFLETESRCLFKILLE